MTAMKILQEVKEGLVTLRYRDDESRDRLCKRADLAFRNILGQANPHSEQAAKISWTPFYSPASDATKQRTWDDARRELINTVDAAIEEYGLSHGSASDPLSVLFTLLNGFHDVARQLRRRHANRATLSISDEYDVQDLLHAVLRPHFSDIREEEYAPSYGQGSSRVDFLIKAERIFVEVKMTRHGLTGRELTDQLAVDVQRYSVHPDCGRLVCFVYDPSELIQNPAGLERDLSRTESPFPVDVLIRPK